ncbi:MAG: hypothetical protein Tsb009_10640 [Planctomycetaceae bacterium]
MNYWKPTLKLSFGVTSMVTTILFFSYAYGLIADPHTLELQRRTVISEQLAVNCSLMVSQKHPEGVPYLMKAACEREDTLLSAALRDTKGKLLLEIGDHVSHWTPSEELTSTPDAIQVPIMHGESIWGVIQLRFIPHRESGLIATVENFLPRFLIFCGMGVFVLSLLYLRRVFRRLSSSSPGEIPERVRATLDTLVEGVLVLDKKENIALANRSFAETLGSTSEKLKGKNAQKLLQPMSSEKDGEGDSPWKAAMNDGETKLGFVLSIATENNVQKNFSVNSTSIVDDAGRCHGALATFDDLSYAEEKNEELKQLLKKLDESRQEIRRQNEELQHLASTDSLTGCLNRRAFFTRFETLWQETSDNEHPFSCIMIDIDKFKTINDQHGHQTGDEVLKHVASLLQSQLSDSEILGRYGGEEFSVLLPGRTVDDAETISEMLRQTIQSKRPAGLPVTISVGVSSRSFGAESPEELVKQADHCLYAAKESGRNCVIRWDRYADHLLENILDGELEADEKRKPQKEPESLETSEWDEFYARA